MVIIQCSKNKKHFQKKAQGRNFGEERKMGIKELKEDITVFMSRLEQKELPYGITEELRNIAKVTGNIKAYTDSILKIQDKCHICNSNLEVIY